MLIFYVITHFQKPSPSHSVQIEDDEQTRIQRLREELEVEREINGELKR